MGLDSISIFAAILIALVVIAAAFLAAWIVRPEDVYFKTWAQANIVLAAAVYVFIVERTLPDVLTVLLPNTLLLAGFGLRWQAARQFGRRRAPALAVWGPAALFLLLCGLPSIFQSYAAIFAIVNTLLAAQTLITGYEFWRDREDRLPSRYGLVAVYWLMGLSFAVRMVQGTFFGDSMPRHLPDDLVLHLHLLIAVAYVTGSGVFALSVAFEQGARSLRAAALRDPLTGLYNRRGLDLRVRGLLERNRAGGRAMVIFDIDHFKRINDRFGHAVGDEALRACAEICANSMRDGDVLARLGGEEFAAVLSGVTAEQAFEIAERIRRAVREHVFSCAKGEVRLTLSAGIFHAVGCDCDLDEMLRSADVCLYSAKSQGRDRVELRAV